MTKDEIKQSVKMSEILSRYGLKPSRAGFICCPFHKEKSASCKIYDGSFYCWMAGVSPEYRRQGVIGALMASLEQWTAENGYKWVTIKTWNSRREMLAFLVKSGFNFTGVEERPATKDNRVLLEKRISKIAG